MVHTDANSGLMFATDINQVYKPLLYFRSIFAVVSRVDAYRLHNLCRCVRYFRVEMHVCYDRYCRQHLRMNLFERFHFL